MEVDKNFKLAIAGVAQLARASAFQAEGRGFESRSPLNKRVVVAAALFCFLFVDFEN